MSRVFVATAMSSSFVGTVHSREELDALVDRLTTSGVDRGDISSMASHDAVIRKLRAVYRDPVEIAKAPGLPRRDLVTRDDVSSVSAVVFGTLVSALGAALPVIAPGGALAGIVAAALTGGAAATAIGKVIRDRIVERLDAVSLENDLLHGDLVVPAPDQPHIRSPFPTAAPRSRMRRVGLKRTKPFFNAAF
jgi:hypothetical protein